MRIPSFRSRKAAVLAPEPEPQPIADETPAEPPRSEGEVENILPGTMLSLGDGRSIAFGEKAEVSPDLAEFLRGRGQVK